MPPIRQITEINYRADIDGLRAIAILSVVAYHVGLPWVTGGFIGVDVFFVISGFLITQLLLREALTEGTISIANFYARRVRRILPGLAVVLTVTLIAGAFLLPDFGEKQGLAKSAMAAVVFSANHYFLASAGGYFNGPSELLPLLHLWSLSVEEQFYAAWPLILIAVVRLSPPEKRIARIRVLIVVLLACSFVASSWLLRTRPDAAFFLLPSRAWELGVGALLATIPFRAGGVERRVRAYAAGLLGVLLLATGFFAFSVTTPFPGVAAAIPVAGAALLIFSGSEYPGNLVSRVLSTKPMVTIGLLSYSWYLWHWPLLSIVRNRRMTESNLPVDCALSLIALACAAVSVRFVENPLRHHKGAKLARRKVLVAGLATLAVLLGLAGALGAWEKYGPQSPFQAMALRERPPHAQDCFITARNWDGKIFREKCDFVPTGQTPGAASLGVLWGDSHAYAWSPAARILSESEGIELEELTRASCPPLLDVTVSVGGKPLGPCRPYNTGVVQGLKDLRNASPNRRIGVVLGARWEAYLGLPGLPIRDRSPESRYDYTDGPGSVAENIEALRAGLQKTIADLRSLDIRVLIMLPGPAYRNAPIRCLAFGYPAGDCAQPTESIEARRKLTLDTIHRVVGDAPDVRVVDPLPFFCPGASCPALMNGHPVSYDDNHLSRSSATAFAPVMRGDFRWLFQDN
jgi:peptidoglycan/LPS O-acetylase OafA/YrhL